MTVKELKEKLEKMPDDAEVRMMMEYEDDSPIVGYHDVNVVFYMEWLQKDGVKAVYVASQREV